MRKILIILIMLVITPCFAADGFGGHTRASKSGVIKGHTGNVLNGATRQTNLSKTLQKNSILHVQEGVTANQNILNEKLSGGSSAGDNNSKSRKKTRKSYAQGDSNKVTPRVITVVKSDSESEDEDEDKE